MSPSKQNGAAPSWSIDAVEAARHIKRLTGCNGDGMHVAVTFQTFDDLKKRKKKDLTLARTIYGSLSECIEQLNELHARGAGVFITVNQTKGKRRKNTDVTGSRAVFIEDDTGANLDPDLLPQLVIASSEGKTHRYFMSCTPDILQWRAVQETLVREFGSDPDAKDQARVLRLAGSWHLKDPAMPHRVRILTCTDAPPYSWEAILAAIPPYIEAARATGAAPDTEAEDKPKREKIVLSAEQLRDLQSALPFIDADSRAKWIKIGHALYCLDAVGRDLYEYWSKQSTKFYDVGDFAAQWNSYHDAKADYRAIFTEAQARGWQNPGRKAPPATRATAFTPNLRTAADILAMTIAPMIWVLFGIIPAGLTLLVASPKIGKSWLALQVALAVAMGGYVLGQATAQGSVLYLGLEDGDRRLQDRLRKLQASAMAGDALARVTFETEWPRINEGGYEAIEAWLQATPDARLIVVDVLQKIRPPRDPKGNGYDQDYEALRQLKALADAHGVAVLTVHHTRKSTADDILETVSGTQGLTGAADAILILKRPRGEERGELHVTGRDLPTEGEFVVGFSKSMCTWSMVGPTDQVAPTEAQASVAALLAGGVAMTLTEIATETGKSSQNTSKLLRRMRAGGQVMRVGRGLYTCTPVVTSYT